MKSFRRGQVTSWTLWKVAWNTFFLQSCWNFQKLQNLGFALAMMPVIKAIHPSRLTRVKALRRHFDFFVTHPYCVSMILGVVANLEEKIGPRGKDASEITRLKVGMMGPLAALGDTLFWATLKPSLALLGVGCVLLSPALIPASPGMGPWIFLLLFSGIHLSVRFGGVYAGYHRGVDIIKDLRRINPQRVAQQIGWWTSVVGGVMAAGYFQFGGSPWLESRRWNVLLLGGLTALMVIALRRGLSASRLFYLLVAFSLAASFILKT